MLWYTLTGEVLASERADTPFNPYVWICGHAGMKTGEDGPTHADPQALQLLQENFVKGTVVSLTPWDPQEIWHTTAAAFRARPAVIGAFVTRPSEPVFDRAERGLAPASESAKGVYRLRPAAEGHRDGTIVLQGSDVTYEFVQTALPRLDADGLNLEVIYIASVELFDLLPDDERRAIFPAELYQEAMAITGFTLPTAYRWLRSEVGVEYTMHPFQDGHYLGSGPGEVVIHEAGLDGEAQYRRIKAYVEALKATR